MTSILEESKVLYRSKDVAGPPVLQRGASGGEPPTLFSAHPAVLPAKHPPYPKSLMLRHEVDTLGFPLSLHPLERYQRILKDLDYVKARDLHVHVGERVRAIGWPVTGKMILPKNGDPMKFISFEDTTGLYETGLSQKVCHRFCHMLSSSRPYLMEGRVEEEFGSISLTVTWIGFLDRYQTRSIPGSKGKSAFPVRRAIREEMDVPA